MLAIGSDHGGFALKAEIMEHLKERGVEYKDFGAFTPESTDYPIYGEAVARAVVSGEALRGILVCGTGIGISIAANRVRGARAALCGDCYSAEMARAHNDANILCLGGKILQALRRDLRGGDIERLYGREILPHAEV
ncbi:MAG: ribose 5-phosphate isomerase B, partial [Firmicutes bacterium]|nr:ribose 5-phosphate isomerase B [Bacillota bacterium]